MTYIYEGVNTELGVEFNKIRLEILKDKISFKAAIMSEDYKTARMLAYKINKNCEDFYEKLDSAEISKSEALIGSAAKTVCDTGLSLIAINAALELAIKAMEVRMGKQLTKSQHKEAKKIGTKAIFTGNARGQVIATIAGAALDGAVKVASNIASKVNAGKEIEAKDLDSYYVTIKQKMKVICAKSKLLINEVDILEHRYGAEKKKEELEKDVKDAKNVFKESEDDDRVSKPWFIKASDNSINACVKIKGYDKPFRARSSMLIIKDIDTEPKVYFSYSDKDKEYHAPGGGWNKKEEPMRAAMREAKEECHINVKIVKPFGERLEYYDEVRDWVKDHVDNPDDYWYGYYSKIFVGQFGSKYNGHVNDEDEDPEINSGKFYNFEDIKDKIYPEYKKAIEDYLSYWNKTVKESEEVVMDKDLMDIALESSDIFAENEEIYTEGFLLSPLTKFKKKLEEIKETKPTEASSAKEIMDWVNAHYDDIEKASKLLEKEPSKMKDDELGLLATPAISAAGFLGAGIAGLKTMDKTNNDKAILASMVPGLVVFLLGFIGLATNQIFKYFRIRRDTRSMKHLTKIKAALQKVDVKKLSKEDAKKVQTIINKINDAETEFYGKIKSIKESVDAEILSVYEACKEGKITEDQKEDLIADIKNKRKTDVVVSEACIDETANDLSLREKYNEVKKLVYEKCANGEMTENDREVVLKEAYNRIFGVKESVSADVAGNTAGTDVAKTSNDDAETKKDLDQMNKDINKEMKDVK